MPTHTPAAPFFKIAHVPLAVKLDAIALALVAVQEAHRDEMPPACWAAIAGARELLAQATLNAP